jgi:hypothetical protein
LRPAASSDEIADVDGLIGAQNNVIAARAQRVAGAYDHLVAACAAHHLHATGNAPAVNIAVVELIFGDNVVVEPVEVALFAADPLTLAQGEILCV